MSRALIRMLAAAMACAAVTIPATAHAASVNPAIAVTPPNPVGTVLLVHSGGWAGPDRAKQERLLAFPGQVFVDRGWRAVSVDYAAGKEGLQSVEDAIGAELAAPGSAGPLCLYGESAGGHLALLAAAHIASVDCVVAMGAPTEFAAYRDEAIREGNPVAEHSYETFVQATFGDPGPQTAAWEPAKVASRINGDVLMISQGDDQVVPAGQLNALLERLPVVGRLVTAVGDFANATERYLHGTLSDEARAQVAAALGSFADRAVVQARMADWARRRRCAGANSALGRIGLPAFRRAVACLLSAVRGAARPGLRPRSRLTRGHTIDVRVVGQVTPARVVHPIATSPSRRNRLRRLAAGDVSVRVRLAPKSAIRLTLIGVARPATPG